MVHNRINSENNLDDKVIEAIQSSQKIAIKAQEQADRLLSIYERLIGKPDSPIITETN